ncbi:sigma-like protein [Streptomyces sp. HNM0574]|uniref:sigma-like protein n=1 Tax=Streptomyces sp. HNM0574 TaxID=2714954 RepID=UPI00146A93BE|nr:sigma-like protein [Streptomyces sp. HNM0574]NLU70096.1 sigma-like protein [Streptomyces sp. HNM0574]
MSEAKRKKKKDDLEVRDNHASGGNLGTEDNHASGGDIGTEDNHASSEPVK